MAYYLSISQQYVLSLDIVMGVTLAVNILQALHDLDPDINRRFSKFSNGIKFTRLSKCQRQLKFKFSVFLVTIQYLYTYPIFNAVGSGIGFSPD